jgi:glucosamine kinase
MRAVNHVQHVLDGRAAGSPFADAVIAACGGDRDAIRAWLASATQTRFAQLARIVLEHAAGDDTARENMIEAGRQVGLIAGALDTAGKLPIALCGGLAEPMRPFLPGDLLARIVPASGDSAAGALYLIRRQLAASPAKE